MHAGIRAGARRFSTVHERIVLLMLCAKFKIHNAGSATRTAVTHAIHQLKVRQGKDFKSHNYKLSSLCCIKQSLDVNLIILHTDIEGHLKLYRSLIALKSWYTSNMVGLSLEDGNTQLHATLRNWKSSLSTPFPTKDVSIAS